MNGLKIQFKTSFYLLQGYFWSIIGLKFLDIILSLIWGNEKDTYVSPGNFITIFLLFVATVLPLSYFKRVINLGASRNEYYTGLLSIYAIWIGIFAVFNVICLKIEMSLSLIYKYNYMNILEIFHWDQFGIIGMFIYQIGVYLLVVSILNLLFSCLQHFIGWIIWIILIVAAIWISISFSTLKPKLVEISLTLLSNDSLLQGFGLNFLISCLFLTTGWLFTRKRLILWNRG
ncbi:hypothetical protein SAMN05444392_101167 [Seinonella peptonophila]|uniref:ABC-2 family transporter protein n=1 Tax=Seinonella peptonophila TaxID=112248 RepID=A0A1M4SVV5_9BACL|nr:hypothetical protein [Seinonella peptonophila]SHE36315.1 hypothetical protein SAMN05444392_101167 [Seinonella peptonophila]